jgi:hypothetical protein
MQCAKCWVSTCQGHLTCLGEIRENIIEKVTSKQRLKESSQVKGGKEFPMQSIIGILEQFFR